MSRTIRENMPERIRRAARAIGLALFTGQGFETWHGVALILRRHLEPQERAVMAFACLRSLDRQDAVKIARAAINGLNSAGGE